MAEVDKSKVVDMIGTILDAGKNMLTKGSIDQQDFHKLKVIKSMGSAMNNATSLMQMEITKERIQLLRVKFKAMGYIDDTPQLNG